MKVITMESSVFRSLTEQIAEIAAHVRAASGDKKAASSDRLLTTREAAQLLNVSTRTLQRMRSEQRIVYVVLRGKCRYRQSEIDRLLDECTVNEDAATPWKNVWNSFSAPFIPAMILRNLFPAVLSDVNSVS